MLSCIAYPRPRLVLIKLYQYASHFQIEKIQKCQNETRSETCLSMIERGLKRVSLPSFPTQPPRLLHTLDLTSLNHGTELEKTETCIRNLALRHAHSQQRLTSTKTRNLCNKFNSICQVLIDAHGHSWLTSNTCNVRFL